MLATKVFLSFTAVLLFAYIIEDAAGQIIAKPQQPQSIPSLSYADSDIKPFIKPQDVTTSTTTTTIATPTTKKKGFFSRLFGKGEKTEKETTTKAPKTTTTRTTTVKTTTTKATKPTKTPKPDKNATPKLPTIASGLPTPFPTQHTTTTVKPGKGEPPKLPSIAAALPQPGLTKQDSVIISTTTTAKPTLKEDFPKLPESPSVAKPKEDFPKLPESPTPAPPSTPTSTISNAWLNTPTTRTTAAPRVAFIPTEKPSSRPGSPQPAPVASTTSDSTDNEILQLSEQLFSKDTNNPFKYVTIDYQSRTWAGGKDDEAPNPLLKVDEAKVYEIPTIKKMRALFNNYEVDTTVHEYVSPNEKQEEDEFIDALLQTTVMKTAMTFLQQKGVVTPNPQSQKDLLKTIWFTIYSRGQGKQGSSGFEHVFLNELKNNTILGLHNWLYYYEMEKSGAVNYQGYMKKVDLGTKGAIAKVRLSVNDIMKPTNSLFIGTSPELELALYTVCFTLRADKTCFLSADGNRFLISTHTFTYRGKNLVGSAFPEI